MQMLDEKVKCINEKCMTYDTAAFVMHLSGRTFVCMACFHRQAFGSKEFSRLLHRITEELANGAVRVES